MHTIEDELIFTDHGGVIFSMTPAVSRLAVKMN
jgi:hypothetical protein